MARLLLPAAAAGGKQPSPGGTISAIQAGGYQSNAEVAGEAPVRAEWQETYWPDNYAPAIFRSPVVLFKRPKQPFYYVNDPQMGWGSPSAVHLPRLSGKSEIHEEAG